MKSVFQISILILLVLNLSDCFENAQKDPIYEFVSVELDRKLIHMTNEISRTFGIISKSFSVKRKKPFRKAFVDLHQNLLMIERYANSSKLILEDLYRLYETRNLFWNLFAINLTRATLGK